LAVDEQPWPPVPDAALPDEVKRAWLLPPVYRHLAAGRGEFIAELRPAVALFTRFGGINYESDPDAPAMLNQFIRAVQQLLARYEGSLIQLTIGDKGSYLYAAFGAPIAHENDPVRAASCALAMMEAADGLPFIEPLQIGITVGRMRTGAYGSTTRRTYGVLGDAVNLSARLMAAARPGHILVSDDARRAMGDAFEWENLPNMRVKGKSEPVTLARLLGLKRAEGIKLQEPSYALPMVGRTAELALIGDKLAQALSGHGQIVGVTAEAGMGKSRLAAEVIALARDRGLTGLGGECTSHGTTTAYLVWQNVWRGFFGLSPSLSIEAQIAGLTEAVRHSDPALLPRLPLLGSVLNLPIPDNDLTASLDAGVRKQSLESLLVALLRTRAASTPLLIVLEDLHWVDALSADLILAIGRSVATLPVLLLLVYRPPDGRNEQLPGINQLAHFTEVLLAQFTEAEAARLIDLKLAQFFGAGVHVPQAFRDRIMAQAAGNPFYIEELLNYLRDLGVDPADEARLEALDLPTTIYNLVLSRVDRLSGAAQITMKVSSVIGRTFRASMVWGIYPQLGEHQRIQAQLDLLAELELTPLDVPDPESVYLFKHVLTQQVAYESLLYSTRSWLHEQIGDYLERVYADRSEQFLDLLAHHYEFSENRAKQRIYFIRAGDAAARNYANSAAVGYYRKALPLLAASEQVDTLLKIGKVLELTADWAGAGEQYAAALALAQELDDAGRQAWCEAASGELLRKQGQYAAAADWLGRAHARFEEVGDLTGIGQALHTAGTVAVQQGEYARALNLYGQSLDIRRQLDDRRNIAALYSNLGIVARYQGDMAAARRYYLDSLALREELGDRWAIAVSLNNLGQLNLNQGDTAAASEQLQRALTIWREIGERWATANTLHNLANVARDEGDIPAAHACYAEAVAFWQELADNWALAYWLEDTARWAVRRDRPAVALQLVARAQALRAQATIPLAPAAAVELETALAPAHAALDAAAAAAAAAAGAALLLPEAIGLALNGG
jgi:predicted ATPase